MKKFLIAAGVGALLVVAQTAVSAAYNPLDRLSEAAKRETSTPAPAVAKTISRGSTAFTPVDMASDGPILGSGEIVTSPPAPTAPVIDRVSGETGRYNLALDAVSEGEKCVKTQGPFGFLRKTKIRGSVLAGLCEVEDVPRVRQYPVLLSAGATILAVTGVVVSDSGKSD